MFRQLQSSLPKDFAFPADLEGLGYYVNENDQIRMIKDPEQSFHYFISKNERYVEMQREAMNECIRRNVMERIQSASMETIRLPINTPESFPHVPILVSSNIATCKRCIVYIGESIQDLGIFAGRLMDQKSIAYGSAVSFVNSINNSSPNEDVGIVIANMGQLLWYRRGRKALSFVSWHAIPRPTAVTPALTVTNKNLIPKNTKPSEHVACVFEEVLAPLVDRGCKLDVIAVGNGAIDLVDYFQQDWGRWEKGMEAIAILSGYVWAIEFFDSRFMEFWRKRARGYVVSMEPLGTPLSGRRHFGCNVFASGEDTYVECIMPHAREAILDYFKLVSRSPDFEDPPIDIAEEEPPTEILGWNADGENDKPTKDVNVVGKGPSGIDGRVEEVKEEGDRLEVPDSEDTTLEEKLKNVSISDG